VDIGAGEGFDLESARIIVPSAKLFAIELFEPNIVTLRGRGIEVYQIDIEKDILPFKDSSIDVVIANQILEHTKEIFWILHEISRVLKIRGRFLVGIPNLASFHNRLLLLIGKQPTSIQLHSAHVRGFTKSDFLKFLNIFGGYQLIDFKGSNFYPFLPLLARPLATMFPSLSWRIFFLFRKIKEYKNNFLNYLETQHLETFYYRGK
jgi:SAM-dependent methyltransferase